MTRPATFPDLPLVAALPESLTAPEAFQRWAHLPHVVYFDSSSQSGALGRYSFVAVDPFEWFEADPLEADPLAVVSERWCRFPAATAPGLPPFQGGVAGLFGYGLSRTLERLPPSQLTDFPVPDLAVGLYDVVAAFDHQLNRAWLISQGFPETDHAARSDRAACRLAEFQERLRQPPVLGDALCEPSNRVANLAPQFDVGLPLVTSNFSEADYLRIVEQAVDYIHAGDVFQVNLAQRLLSRAICDPVSLYMKLRQANPAPYSGYLDLGDWQVCSSSPECFLKVRGREVETRPIKGTRGRSPYPEADLFAGTELQLSAKDRAENVMIVDLMRNDLSRVCDPESVRVAELCSVETYAHVKHLVSSVRGQLQQGLTPWDLLRACFPGGSITGAPKIRAMEIIAELEPTARGAYCGSLGYIGFDGQMDSSILIRTITAGGGWWQIPVGGGIVAQSRPEEEYRETWHKARGLLRAIMPQT